MAKVNSTLTPEVILQESLLQCLKLLSCSVEFYTCIQNLIQLTSKFFFSREHVAIIVVIQFPPRLK